MRVRVLAPLTFGGRRYAPEEIIDIPHDSPLEHFAEMERWAQTGNVRHLPPEATTPTAPVTTASTAPLVPERRLGGRRPRQ